MFKRIKFLLTYLVLVFSISSGVYNTTNSSESSFNEQTNYSQNIDKANINGISSSITNTSLNNTISPTSGSSFEDGREYFFGFVFPEDPNNTYILTYSTTNMTNNLIPVANNGWTFDLYSSGPSLNRYNMYNTLNNAGYTLYNIDYTITKHKVSYQDSSQDYYYEIANQFKSSLNVMTSNYLSTHYAYDNYIRYVGGSTLKNTFGFHDFGDVYFGWYDDGQVAYAKGLKIADSQNGDHTMITLSKETTENDTRIFLYQSFSYDMYDLDADVTSGNYTATQLTNKYLNLIPYERALLANSQYTSTIKTHYLEATQELVVDGDTSACFPLKTSNMSVDYEFSDYSEALVNFDIYEDYVIYYSAEPTIPYFNAYLHPNISSGRKYYFQISLTKNEMGIEISAFLGSSARTLTIKSVWDVSDSSETWSTTFGTQTLDLLPRGTAPTEIVIDSVTTSTIQVAVETNMEYSRYGAGENKIYATNGLFTGLTPGETYTIFANAKYIQGVQARSYGTDNEVYKEVTLPTKYERTDTPDITIVEITDSSFRIIGESGVEYSLDGYSFDINGTITNLEEDTDYMVYARYAETDTYFAGPTVSRTIHTQKTIEVLRKKVLDQLEESHANHNGEGYTYVPGVYGSLRSQILAATTVDELNNLAGEIEPQMSFAASKDAGILAAKAKLKNSDSNFTEDDINKEIAKIESLEYGKDNADKIATELSELDKVIEINRYKEEKLKAFCDYFNVIIKDKTDAEIDTLLPTFNTYYMSILNCTTKDAVDAAYNSAINGIN